VVSFVVLTSHFQTRLTNPYQDENRPTCRRCERCGFECSGAKEIAFIDQGENFRSRSRKSSPILKIRSVPEDSLPASPGMKGFFEIQICICYTRKYLLRGGPVDLASQDLQLSDSYTAINMEDNTYLLHRAILTLAVIFFGAQHRSSSIQNRGYIMHGKILKQLNATLSDPHCYLRDDVLLSVVTLALLECFVPTGRKYYLKHMSGLEKLLELRGPGMHRERKSLGILKGVRRMVIFAALSKRKESILAREEWKRIQGTDCTGDEMEEQCLMNALADCTVVIAEYDKVVGNSKSDIEDSACQRDEVTRRALNLLEQLHLWKKRWDTEERNSHLEIPAELQQTEETRESVTTTLNFANSSASIMFMLYNTALIYVFRILASLDGHPGAKWEERSAALEICRCIPYHLSQKSRLDSGSMTVASLAVRTAWKTLGGSGSPGGRWMIDLLQAESSEVFARGLWVD